MLKATGEVVTTVKRYYQPLYWLIALLLICNNVKASDALLLLSADNPVYHSVAEAIIDQGPTMSIETSYPEDLADNAHQFTAYPLVIAVGSKATEQAMQFAAQDSVIVSTFIPSQRFHSLSKQYAASLTQRHIRTTAIYLDQPLERQLRLAKQIKPDLKRLGFSLGPDSEYQLPELQRIAIEMDLSLNYQTLTLESNPIQRILPIIKKSDLFMVIPDQSTLNRTTAKWLLYMSLRNRVPLLAFTQNYVQAGAVAACITTPEDIGRYTAKQLHKIIQGTLPPPSYSPYFTIITNPRVARQLGLSIQTAQVLQQIMVEGEPQ
ncbi:ABC transporter substrate binding protein [Amphritea sp. 1_MG-2023]|uniref:ABC transporter substrate-binding protein n=1 Tax=Amphritea sp. 1_MG-2023 TaxID=3062670 RepID=UPI0026E378FD|nr:ABC transporter substrate binding protein [Amphritea sp. 1_MG-2023]MDO6565218.1 ABC transporter substrate binding protein [Amphritea sp. 1_MG-2023]